MILGIIGKQLTLIIQKENLDRMKKGDPMFLDLVEGLKLMVCDEGYSYLTREYKDLPGDDTPITPL